MTNRLTVALVVFGVMGCSSQVPLDNTKCPCAPGYMCCDTPSPHCVLWPGGECGNMPPTADGGPVHDSGVDTGPPDAPPPSHSVQSIAIGHAHACALLDDSTVTCIGDNSKGQGTPPPPYHFYEIYAGGDVTCGFQANKGDITENGTLVCWGDSTYGQTSPPPDHLTSVVIGARHACGTDRDGHLVCWGDNSLGQATPPAGVYSNLSAGHNHTCAARRDAPTDGSVMLGVGPVVCWGDNSLGQSTPPPFDSLGNVYVVSAGGDHTCVLDAFEQAWCWGDQTGGQSLAPAGQFSITSLAAGPGHACAIKSNSFPGPLTCWGDDWGDATPVPPSGRFLNVIAGDYRTCAQSNDTPGNPYICWGATYEPWY